MLPRSRAAIARTLIKVQFEHLINKSISGLVMPISHEFCHPRDAEAWRGPPRVGDSRTPANLPRPRAPSGIRQAIHRPPLCRRNSAPCTLAQSYRQRLPILMYGRIPFAFQLPKVRRLIGSFASNRFSFMKVCSRQHSGRSGRRRAGHSNSSKSVLFKPVWFRMSLNVPGRISRWSGTTVHQ